jgi:hypothetical protein
MSDYQTPTPQPAAPPAPVLPPTPPVPMMPYRRSPGLATVLSIIPGVGPLYLGLYERAAAIVLVFALGVWLADATEIGPFIVMFVWFFGLFDAYRQAQAINLGVEVEPLLRKRRVKPMRASLGFGVFLVIVGALILWNQFYPMDFSFLEVWWPLILVLGGVYLIGRYLLEQRRRQQESAPEITP